MKDSEHVERSSGDFRLLRRLFLRSGLALTLLCAATSPQLKGQSADPEDAPRACRQLRDFLIPPAAIALPTGGARVHKAKLRRTNTAEYCKVIGEIRPVQTAAQSIRFEVNLPTSWNGKAVQFGGAVFDGSLTYSNGLKQPTLGPNDVPTPLQQGYVTYGSDSGHHKHYLLLPDQLNLLNPSFADNKEERSDFTRDAIKKTHDVMVALSMRRYGRAPGRSFFLGSSSGGHEALEAVQRWPGDYDGVLSGYPSWDGAELLMQFVRTSQALYSKGGFLPRSSTKLLARSVLNACDSLDGVKDGLVSHTSSCQFDPSTLLCHGATHKGCLSAQQLATVRTFATEQRTAQPVLPGVQSISGYNVLSGADLTGSLGFFHRPEKHPKLLFNASTYMIGSKVIRHFIAQDRDFNALQVNPATGAPFEKGLLMAAKEYDATDADLTAFAAHGGKLMLVHGTADVIIPTGSTVMYYQRVQAAMGEDAADKFLRLYLVPGFGHGVGSFEAGFDSLRALDHWVETGAPPENLVVEDKKKAGHGRKRPLCSYPTWPAYNGTGDPQLSQSFHCAD